MTGSSHKYGSISKMSLSMATDSTFYKAKLWLAEVHDFGRNQGCQVYDKKNRCPKYKVKDFCKAGDTAVCSVDNNFISICSTSSHFLKTEQCGIRVRNILCKNQMDFGDRYSHFGRDSKCTTVIVFFFISYLFFLFTTIFEYEKNFIYIIFGNIKSLKAFIFLILKNNQQKLFNKLNYKVRRNKTKISKMYEDKMRWNRII